MNDTVLRVLATQYLKDAHERGFKGSATSFRRWLKRNGYKSISSTRAERILGTVRAKGVRTNEWEGLTKEGKVTLSQTRIDWDFENEDAYAGIEAFVKERIKPIKLKATPSGTKLGVLSIPDIHVGKLAWGPEVGNNYDSNIAVEVYTNAAGHLLEQMKSAGVGHILYVVGNDLLHVDGFDNATTAGTPQDMDTRWQRAFKRAKEMVVATALAAAKFAVVDIVVQPGNHDRVLTWTLGEVLAAYFSRAKGVNVDNRESYRKYRRFGRLLFGISHGDKVKTRDLPGIMPLEVPKDWGETTYREWLLGHTHRKHEYVTVSFDEKHGVRMRYLPSLSGQDRWHYEHGYSNMRNAEAHIYDPERGVQLATYYYFPGGEE